MTETEGTFWKEMEERAGLLSKDLTLIRGIITDDELSRARTAKQKLAIVVDELSIERQASPNVAMYDLLFKNGAYAKHVNRIERLADERQAIVHDMEKRPWLYELG